MKTVNRILLLLFISLQFSCNDNDEAIPTPENYNILVESFVQDQANRIISDYDADVFIYWGIYSLDIAGTELLEDGSILNDSQKIKPDIKSNIDEKGKCTLTFEEIDAKITIIIRSKIKDGAIAISSFTNTRKDIYFNNTFL